MVSQADRFVAGSSAFPQSWKTRIMLLDWLVRTDASQQLLRLAGATWSQGGSAQLARRLDISHD
jgi:hypothetical protein